MRRRAACVAIGLTAALAGCAGPTATTPAAPIGPAELLRWNFDADASGALPGGAQVFAGTWLIRAEDGAPTGPHALCQTGNAEYPAIGLGNAVYTDLTLVTRFKPISGRVDQAAGLIFRVQDG